MDDGRPHVRARSPQHIGLYHHIPLVYCSQAVLIACTSRLYRCTCCVLYRVACLSYISILSHMTVPVSEKRLRRGHISFLSCELHCCPLSSSVVLSPCTRPARRLSRPWVLCNRFHTSSYDTRYTAGDSEGHKIAARSL